LGLLIIPQIKVGGNFPLGIGRLIYRGFSVVGQFGTGGGLFKLRLGDKGIIFKVRPFPQRKELFKPYLLIF